MKVNLPKNYVFLKKAIFTIAVLFSLNIARSQDPAITGLGYIYLGTQNVNGQPHYYYVSHASNVQTWQAADLAAKALVGHGGQTGYLATLTSQTENDQVANWMVTAVGTVVGPGTFFDWGDDRNAFIGLNDYLVENTFVWSNGEACNNFRNWNQDEPNNANDEDGVQMSLADATAEGIYGQSLGKWNDLTNPSTQRFIVEFGPTNCAPPAVNRGTEGCSHGYWKSASKKWWTGAAAVGTYTRNSSFFGVFDIAAGSQQGLSAGLTFDGALNLGGGGYSNVARQGVAALLNATSTNIDFPYTEQEILDAVESVFETGSAQLPDPATNYMTMKTYNVGALGTELDRVNNLGCPINAFGIKTENVSGEMMLTSSELSIKAMPNPSAGAFNLQLNTSSFEKISLRVLDMQGKLIEKRDNLIQNQSLQIGKEYLPGVYFVEVMQGAVRKQLRLVKTGN